ncbi:MAG: hypothetical protein ACHQAX_03695 [Gammaproteobacteria bacterium]
MNIENKINIFLNKLTQFDYELESIDRIWHIIFPDAKNQWYHIRVLKYQDTFYIDHLDGHTCRLEILSDNNVKVDSDRLGMFSEGGIEAWEKLIPDALKWLGAVKKNWIKANHKVYELYPLNRRYGVLPKALVNASLKDFYRLDHDLGADSTNQFVQLLESRYFSDDKNTTRPSMTANDYFEYCKIAYIAAQSDNNPVDETLTGCQMYRQYADGRHEGLLDIDPNSEEEFAAWIDGSHPKKMRGGHPWEIKRGGNTTHIDLYVMRPMYRKEGFTIVLNGPSIGRLKETLCMFLALHKAGLPISINDPEGIRKRLLGMDSVGIVPRYRSLHRANQHFPKGQSVYDVLYYDDLSRYKRRLTPFIIWEALPLLKPV